MTAVATSTIEDAVTKREVWENDSDLSDNSDLTDVSFPVALKTNASAVFSPCSVSDVASAADPSWPARPLRRKRTRMSQEERKVRHREVQRQFMKRKRARIAELRGAQREVETQLRLASALHETEQLKNENDALTKHYESCECCSTAAAQARRMYPELLFSVPSQDRANDDMWIAEHEWSELFDVLSDDASAADSDGSSVLL